MHSLRSKFLVAFILVALLGVGTVAVVANRVTARQLTLYVGYGSQARAEAWAQLAAQYYDQSWQSVEALLRGTLPAGVSGQGPGQGRGRGQNAERRPDDRVLIVSPEGQIVVDTANELVGESIDAATQTYGAPVIVDGETVGTLLVTTHDLSGESELERRFLDAVNQAVLWAVLVVAIVALAAASLLSRQLVAPLRQLTAAAEAMARGDLSQRVETRSRDEVGALGDAFNKMASDLERAERQRRQMTADIAHELRNPLSVIRGNLEGMIDGIYAPDGEQLATIYDESLLLQRLVEDLRLLTLADAGQLDLVRTPVDVVELLDGVAGSARAPADEKALRLRVDAPQEPLVVDGDAQRLRQVIGNLVNNAIRYTPQGGMIALGAKRAGPQIQLSVADTGPGISPEDLPYIFDRFYRGDAARDRESGGSGLGLAIAQALVQAHGGTVTVDSKLGQGTTLTLSLPARQA